MMDIKIREGVFVSLEQVRSNDIAGVIDRGFIVKEDGRTYVVFDIRENPRAASGCPPKHIRLTEYQKGWCIGSDNLILLGNFKHLKILQTLGEL